MNTLTQIDPALEEEKSPRHLWKASVGKAFKLTDKSYGVRTVTYTLIKSVRDGDTPADFIIEVSCVEIIARVTNAKRGHSSICKEGTIHQNDGSIITPNSFGEECGVHEFEKISESILAHATMNLDLVMPANLSEGSTIDVPIDLPHLQLTDMEACLIRNSPFLVRDIYFLTVNSRRAALESINEDLLRASRNSRLTDVSDPIYVAKKNDAVISLRRKLNEASLETEIARYNVPSATANIPLESRENEPHYQEKELPESKNGAAASRRPGLSHLERDSLTLALLGKASSTSLVWEVQNPSKEGAVFRIGKVCGLLMFVRWAHLSGRAVTEHEAASKKLRSYFTGPDAIYAGPEKDGIYPLLRPE